MRCRGAVVAIIVVLSGLLGGCSAVRITYNQGPTLGYWWLDRYADFSSEQAPRVRSALAEWFSWHRASQLPDYAQALAQAQKLALENVTADTVCAQIEPWQRRFDRALEPLLPAAAELVQGFAPEQIRHLEQRYARNMEEAERDYLQPDPADRREANFKRTLERAETLYGPLDEAQKRLLADGLAQSPFDPQVWLAERRQRQADLVRAMRQWQAGKADTATVQAGLRRAAQELMRSPRPAYRAYAQRTNEANCALVAQLHNSTTPAQRKRAAQQLRDWEDDLKALMKP